jgi:co-chaperonin GroES (HSP10)
MFQPLHGLCTVILDDKKKTTKGGIVLPDDYKDVLLIGTIRAVGLGGMTESGVLDRPPLHPGDRVMIAQQTERTPQGARVVPFPTISDDGVVCSIINHRDIWGIIKDGVVQN